jgi:hypothetical protein
MRARIRTLEKIFWGVSVDLRLTRANENYARRRPAKARDYSVPMDSRLRGNEVIFGEPMPVGGESVRPPFFGMYTPRGTTGADMGAASALGKVVPRLLACPTRGERLPSGLLYLGILISEAGLLAPGVIPGWPSDT